MRIFVSIFLILTSHNSLEAKTSEPIWSEYFSCKLDSGKTLEDLDIYKSNWNKFMDESDVTGYDAAILYPRYVSPSDEHDFIWVGHSSNSIQFGIGNDNWGGEEAKELRRSFPASCNESFSAQQFLIQSNYTLDEMNPTYPVSYRDCKLLSNKTLEDAYKAVLQSMSSSHSRGIKVSSRIIEIKYGTPAKLEPYDFILSFNSPTWEEWGRGTKDYDENILGSPGDNEVNKTFICENPRMYSGSIVRWYDFIKR